MNLLDYIIIITMVYLIVKGIFRGLIREIASLAGIILGIWLANLFQPQMTDLLSPYLPSVRYLPLISFAAIFAAILILCNILGWGLKLLFKKLFLGWVDRTLGACLAIAKGVIITYLIIVMLTFFLPSKTPLIAASTLAPLIIRSYQSMISLISPNHYKNWKRKIMGKQKEIGKIMSDKIKDIVKKDE
ncbi:MAG: CvpA family protein [Deltaproteobacteria bacterium]|nr:CvpA family protein [Deltaproteobacteria bacterium]